MEQNLFKKNVLELNGMLNRSIISEKNDYLLIKEKTDGYNDYYIYKNNDNLIQLIEHSDDLNYMFTTFDDLTNDSLSLDLN